MQQAAATSHPKGLQTTQISQMGGDLEGIKEIESHETLESVSREVSTEIIFPSSIVPGQPEFRYLGK